MNVCTIAVRDPTVFQNRFLAIVARDAVDVMPSNILWTGIKSMSVWSRKAVLH